MSQSQADGQPERLPYRQPKRPASKYLHIGWAVPALVILVVGIILKAHFDTAAAFCGSGLGEVEQELSGSSADCSGAIAASSIGTAMAWLGGVALVLTVGSGIMWFSERRAAAGPGA
ncbi:MAG TPA: hypothetical protein VFX16_20830 [Pseudonocardiaceae bacterium]|nr:hypothetical protein [Pseudonocardiaceae bacterium]